jgi:hypothetical protein
MSRPFSSPSLLPHLVALLTLVSIASADSLSLNNGVTTVKIDRTRGGAITWVSVSGGTNLINLHDLGRLVQQSYYAGARLDRRAEGQSPAWSPWTWNPVQGGSFAHAPGILDKFESRDGVLHSLTRPKLWDMPDETAACTMEQQTEFEPGQRNVIRVTNTLVIRRPADDRWGAPDARHQELPAIYLVRAFATARIYEGEGRWTDFELPALSKKGWGRPVAPKRAMAFFRADGLGFAIYSPAADATWNSGVTGTSRSADPMHADTTHVAPIATVTLDRDTTYTFRYWMLLGDATTLARDLDKLLSTYP